MIKTPDYIGKYGQAWEIDVKQSIKKPAHYAAVFSALLDCPNAHPFWRYHLLSVTSLRNIVGVAPARKHYLEAEHEISVFAVNPEVPTAEPEPGAQYDLLQPYDLIQQFHGVNAEQAYNMGKAIMKACCDGLVTPDSDWRLAFEKQIIQMIEHYVQGHGNETGT